MLGVLACYISVDLQMARAHYRLQRSRGHEWKPFIRWWFKKSATRLLVIGGITLAVTSSLFLYQYGPVIPEFSSRIRISNGTLWALMAPAAVVAFVFLDLFIAWRYYRDRRGAETSGVRFYRWWLRKSVKKFSVAGLLGLLLLVGICYVQSDNLIPLKGETKTYLARAREYHKQKKYRESIAELRKVIKADPDDEEAYLQLARSFWSLGSKQEALDSYKTVIRINQRSYFAHEEMGRLAFNGLGDTELALTSALKAAELALDKPKPHLLLALIYARTGRMNLALEEYRTVLKKSPGHDEARVKLIESLLVCQSWKEAGIEAERSPKGTRFMVLRARVDMELGKEKEALAILNAATEQDTGSPFPLVALGDLYARRGDYILATTSYEGALKRAPEDVPAMSSYALLLADHGADLNRSVALATMAYKKSWPKDPDVVGAMGWVRFKQGKLKQSLPLLRDASTGNSSNPLHHYHFGVALLQVGRTEEGRREVETALKISRTFDGAAAAAATLAHPSPKQSPPRKPSA